MGNVRMVAVVRKDQLEDAGTALSIGLILGDHGYTNPIADHLDNHVLFCMDDGGLLDNHMEEAVVQLAYGDEVAGSGVTVQHTKHTITDVATGLQVHVVRWEELS